jgi:hypothetical protein
MNRINVDHVRMSRHLAIVVLPAEKSNTFDTGDMVRLS